MQKSKVQLKMKKVLLLLCIANFVFSIPTAHAARLLLDAPETTVGTGQQMEVRIVIDSEGADINAVGGSILIPSFIRIDEVRDGNSLITLWAERPEVSERTVSFAGIIPGGWNGIDGTLFSVLITAETEGAGALRTRNVQVLAHDGKGTEVPVTPSTLGIAVRGGIPLKDLVTIPVDTEPPLPFTPVIGTDPSVFEGDTFVVFATTDEGSGINYYEIYESKRKLRDPERREWERAESPHRLSNQEREHYVYVRAIDRADNVRVAMLPPEQRPIPGIPIVAAVLILALLLLLVYRRYRHMRS